MLSLRDVDVILSNAEATNTTPAFAGNVDLSINGPFFFSRRETEDLVKINLNFAYCYNIASCSMKHVLMPHTLFWKNSEGWGY